jgi:hypothetical protein
VCLSAIATKLIQKSEIFYFLDHIRPTVMPSAPKGAAFFTPHGTMISREILLYFGSRTLSVIELVRYGAPRNDHDVGGGKLQE